MKELKSRIRENGITYILVGDYYVPDLKLPGKSSPVGKWGRLHRSYLKKHEPMVFNELVLSGKLHDYLADVDKQCAELQEFLMIQFMEREAVTDVLKMQAQLEWVRRVNNIRNRVDEIILNEMVYA